MNLLGSVRAPSILSIYATTDCPYTIKQKMYHLCKLGRNDGGYGLVDSIEGKSTILKF